MTTTLPHLFLSLGVGDVGSQRTILENLEVGCASRFSGTQNCDQGIGRDVIVEIYDEVKMPPCVAIGIQHPQAPTTSP